MPIQKFEIAAPASLDEMMKGNGKVASAAQWIRDNLEPSLLKAGFEFDRLGSSGYPLIIAFSLNKSTQADAQRLVTRLSKTFGPFTPGIENKMTPFVRLSKRFKTNDAYTYCAVTLWMSGKLSIYLSE